MQLQRVFRTNENTDQISVMHTLKKKLEILQHFFQPLETIRKEESQIRLKRSVEKGQYASPMSKNFLSESLDGHKIRHVQEKIAHLDPSHDQLVVEILKKFCPGNEKTLVG